MDGNSMNRCRFCGAELVEGAFVCGNCGARAHFERRPAKGNRTALIIICSLLSTGMAATVCVAFAFFALALLGHSHENSGRTAGQQAISCNQVTTSIIPEPSGKPQFVYFYDDSCPACQKLRPTISEFESTYRGKIDFIKIDVTTPEGECEFRQQGFEYIPSMLFIDKEGIELDYSDGSLTKSELKQELDGLLGIPGAGPGINV